MPTVEGHNFCPHVLSQVSLLPTFLGGPKGTGKNKDRMGSPHGHPAAASANQVFDAQYVGIAYWSNLGTNTLIVIVISTTEDGAWQSRISAEMCVGSASASPQLLIGFTHKGSGLLFLTLSPYGLRSSATVGDCRSTVIISETPSRSYDGLSWLTQVLFIYPSEIHSTSTFCELIPLHQL